MWSLDWDLENQRKMAVLPSGSSVFGRTRRITNETWTRLLLFLGNSAQAQWCVLCRRTEVRSALPRRTEEALNPGAGPPSPYCCDPKLQHLLRRSPRCEWVWQVGEHVKDLSDASCSRISESTEGFRQGGRELEEGAPSSGVGGRVGVSSLVHLLLPGCLLKAGEDHTDGPRGLRRGGGWSEGLPPRPRHTGGTLLKPRPSQLEEGSSPTVGSKGLGDKPTTLPEITTASQVPSLTQRSSLACTRHSEFGHEGVSPSLKPAAREPGGTVPWCPR